MSLKSDNPDKTLIRELILSRAEANNDSFVQIIHLSLGDVKSITSHLIASLKMIFEDPLTF